MRFIYIFTALLFASACSADIPMPIEPEAGGTHELEEFAPGTGVLAVPVVMACTTKSSEDYLKEEYNELPFLSADGIVFNTDRTDLPGKLQIFVSPDASTFTIEFAITDDVHCMLMNGEHVRPGNYQGLSI